ncbi:putative signal transducing protein [Polaribacter sargassicola]|uniref:putative signal transducing protein n=1 Tax=Polaribacter sargassicola TaxID=2836891 RepID=UPI001F36C3C5|nr:DUF2007 domain-containing protein [Polaribacter sp. DS7-9]MCG1035929.1 DUF2007 domain-containing protein [Polaribacter sp. DS7-9]
MKKEHVKIFSNTFIIVKGLQNILEDNKISSIIKDRFESARLAGFAESTSTVELYVLNLDLEKAVDLTESYKKEINS